MPRTVLFQGASVTESGRDRAVEGGNEAGALGCGYVNLIAAKVLKEKPQSSFTFLNRGISGDRIGDLYARWKKDALNLQPNIISILVGVNDVVHEFEVQNGVELDRFETIYRLLLELTRQSLPNVQIIVCEPFLLPCRMIRPDWLLEMQSRQSLLQRLARDVGVTFVPLQAAFDRSLKLAPAEYWAKDGIHPTLAGHQLLADTWLEHVAL